MSRASADRSIVMSATRGRARARILVCVGSCDADEVAANLYAKLKAYMTGFMDDPAYVSKGDEPSGRDHWPAADGSSVSAWDSPLAHRMFFDWIANVRNGGTCVDAGAMKNLLARIGQDETECTQDVADGLIHTMNKGAEDGCTTWPEYLNSIFRIGPVSDPRQPKDDPTIAQLAAEAAGGPGAPVVEDAGPARGYLGGMAARVLAGVRAEPIPFLFAGTTKPETTKKDDGPSGTTIALVAGGLVVAGVIVWKVLL